MCDVLVIRAADRLAAPAVALDGDIFPVQARSVLEQRPQADSLHVLRQGQIPVVADGREEVQPRDQLASLLAAFGQHARPTDDEGHLRGRVVQEVLRPELVLGHALAVVAGEDDESVLGPARVLYGLEQPADLRVHHLHVAVVAPHVVAPVGLRPLLVHGAGTGATLPIARRLLMRRLEALGQRRQIVQQLRVGEPQAVPEVVARPQADVVRLRVHGGQEEGLPFVVVADVGFAGLSDALVAFLALTVDAAGDHVKAGDEGRVRLAHVPLAGVGRLPVRVPSDPLPQIGDSRADVVPVPEDARLARHPAREDGASGRRTQGVGAVALPERRPALRQPVEARRAHLRVPERGDRVDVLLIGDDQEDVRLSTHSELPP